MVMVAKSKQHEVAKVGVARHRTMNGERGSKQAADPKTVALLQPPCKFVLENYAETKREEREW